MPDNGNEEKLPMAATKKFGTVMVVGAGVSGIQAALDAAGSGFRVYLVDKGPAMGGKMAQLDKTFPTNDCSMCILSPKFIECAVNPNISIITNARIEGVDGEAGNFEVHLVQEPRYVDEGQCTGCGTCAEYCPVNILDTYNENLGTQKCIHVHFPQAVPAVSIVDPVHCLYLNRQECQICVPTCPNKAIDFHQQLKRTTLEVGSLILAPGYEPYEPEKQSMYGYGRYPNIVTGLEYERLLSASGPHSGELKRPSDGKTPHKIAWIQCVGSRDETSGCTYCSAVCCMYATKQVILSKEHHPEMEAVVLHNDIRAFGKGFERYYNRAKDMDGVRYIWSRATILEDQPDTGNIVIRYRINGTEVKDEAFDLVVLSVGLSPTEGNRELVEMLSIDTNQHGFCANPEFSPIETSRRGIYSCGVFNGPMDIPDSVTMASGAASLASQLLWEERGTMVEEKVYPEERDVVGAPPRVGVFVCDCGTNVAKVVDVPSVVDYAKGMMGVVYSVEETFACSVDAITNMAETIREKDLNRVVVAACTPRTHEPVFRGALKEAGLNPHLFEFANIREHCSFVHMSEKREATEKAKDLVRMAVSKALLLEPLYELSYSVTRSALVIGGGVAGMVSSLALARQGIKVTLIEKNDALGGLSMRIPETLEGGDVRAYMQGLIDQVHEHLLIQIQTGCELSDFSGYVGNYVSKFTDRKMGMTKEVKHGVTIVATGANESKPEEYLYGEDDRVMTLLELDEMIASDRDRFKDVQAMVFIQCVGSRDDQRPYCSRVCCSHSIKNALQLKEINPEMDITILYRDMRTFGFREDYYKEASDQGVVFIRYDLENKPELEIVEEEGQRLFKVQVAEPMLGQCLELDANMVCLAPASVAPSENKSLSQMLKITQNEDGFFLEAHMKLRPVDFATDGIFMCGTAHSPKFIEESIAQAQAAASRAVTILAQEALRAGGSICVVDAAMCTGCGICEQVCPFHAVAVEGSKGIAEVNPALCKGCGLCSASCRSGALDVDGYNNEQTLLLLQNSLTT
jgi:heterodisulfide reductase subunit A